MNFKINISIKVKEKQGYLYLFLLCIFMSCLLMFAISSCATTSSSNSNITPEIESYNLEINKTHPYLTQLYYRDIISFSAENIIGNMITYDEKADLYYVPGKTGKTIISGLSNIEVVNVSNTPLAGFSCVDLGIILYADNNGNVFKTEKNSKGNWEEKHLFLAKSGKKPFNAMTADQKNIYLYSQKDYGVYKFDYSGNTVAFIKINGIDVSCIDIKSNYLYILSASGVIVLADYKLNRIETEYMANDRTSLNTTLLIKQEITETEIILSRNGIKDSLNYAIYPLSSLHKMVIEEGYIKKISTPLAGCSHVLSDSNGKIIFPVKSNLIDLDTALSRKVTVTGMTHDADYTKIIVISAIDN